MVSADRLIELFNELKSGLTGPERDRFLAEACQGEPELKEQIISLLQAYEGAGDLLKRTVLSPTERVTEQPGDKIGGYKLLEKVGEGGGGVVYVAEQEEPFRRRVALKIIKLGMDTKLIVARFEAERQALAMMDHPNIAKVLDAGATDTGRPYFMMELVRGIRITDYCEQNNLSTKDRLNLFIQICQAIQHAHQKGIIHRDIKPSNILVTLHDGVPVPKVIDFGIAKAIEGRLTDAAVYTRVHEFIGTPAYMSPEQADMSGLDIDTRSDIYSLGVLLYELLTGSTPFAGKELMASGIDAMRKTIREKLPRRPSTQLTQELAAAVARLKAADGSEPATEDDLNASLRRLRRIKEAIPMIRGDLDWIVMKCLEKDRTRRYEAANGLTADLKRFLGNEPVVARPPSTTYRLQKAFQRNKLSFVAGAAVAAALVAGLSLSTWQATVATLARREAERAGVAERDQGLAALMERDKALAAQAGEAAQRQRAELGEKGAKRLLYVANIKLAQQMWEQNNVGRVRQVLEETAMSPERSFEWYFLQRQTHLELKTFRGHAGAVNAVAFSPDGRWILTGGDDRVAKLWEAATGKELLILKGHGAAIRSVAFSRDGQRIATASEDQTAHVWDSASGRELLVLKGHTAAVWFVAFSPDGQRIVTGSRDDRTAKVWEAISGKELFTLSAQGNGIVSVALSWDGQRIVTGTRDRTATIWETASGKEILTIQGEGRISLLAFSPDGGRIVSSADQTAKIWDATNGKELLILKGHSAPIISVAFSPNGQWIVTGSKDQTAKVWQAANGKELLTLRGHSAPIQSVAVSPSDEWIVTASEDQTTKVWEAPPGREMRTIKGHNGAIRSVAFSTDSQRIITGTRDKTAKVWEAGSRKELLTLKGHSAAISSVAVSTDDRWIVTGSLDQTAKVWEAGSGKPILTLSGHGAEINSVAFSQDAQRILTGSDDHTAKVWEAGSGKELLTLSGHGAPINSVALSPDGQRVVTASFDQTAKVWQADSGKELLTLKGHHASISSVTFSQDGRRIFTGSADHTAKVWETGSGKELLTLKGHSAPVNSVALSPDGHRIVTASFDQTAKVWEADSGKELLTLTGHGGSINSVAISPDGQRIVTGGEDQLAKLWEAASVEQVASWNTEERAGADYLLAQQRDRSATSDHDRVLRARDPGAIKQWLVLLPIAFEGSGGRAMRDEQVGQESQLRPRAGERIKTSRNELVWRAVQLEDHPIDFSQVAGGLTQSSMAYAVCYLFSEALQSRVLLKVGSDDQSKVYLNGKLVYQRLHAREYLADEDVAAGIELKAGMNVVVFKVANETSKWLGSIRFTDREGRPVPGLKVTLDPDSP